MADPGAVNLTAGQKALERVIGPSPLTRAPMDKLGERVSLQEEAQFPKVEWTRARYNKQHGRAFPQAIAHRGYKAKYPENTMASFRGAVAAGAHAIETDIHLTRDRVPVLSHDATLKRCFGRPEKLADLAWADVAPLETLAEPGQHMPRLADLLTYLAGPGLEHVWVLLDIKLDDRAEEVMAGIARAMEEVAPSSSAGSESASSSEQQQRAWKDRVVLGVWATKYVPLCAEYLPGFPVAHIGFSTVYARQFLKVPNVGFNMLQVMLVGPLAALFLRKAREEEREMFAWTVNNESNMRWCVKKGIDGVITDDPAKYLAICENWQVESTKPTWELRQIWSLLRINILALIFGVVLRFRFGSGLELKRPVKKIKS